MDTATILLRDYGGSSVNGRNKPKPAPNGELRAALFAGSKVIRIGPRLWSIGAFAASSPQLRSVLNILESAVAGLLVYAILSFTSLGFNAIDRRIGGIGEMWLSQAVRYLIVEGGLITSGFWLLASLLASAKLAAQTTWRMFVPSTKQGGGENEL